MSTDFAAIRREEFAALDEAIYLNSASIGPIPERTRRRLDEYSVMRTAPHRMNDHDFFSELDQARALTARLLNVTPGEIALAFNTSYGLNVAARGLPLEPGDVVLASDREFPANVYPWMRLAERGVSLELAPVTANGWPDEDHLVERMADPKVRVLAVSLVQFSNGYTVDLARLSKRARETNTFLVVDAIQGLGAVPVDLQATPVDILSCGGQKWLLSPWGSGFVYVRKELIPVVEPVVMGWMAFEGTDDFTRLTDYDPHLRGGRQALRDDQPPLPGFRGVQHLIGPAARGGHPRHRRAYRRGARADARLGEAERHPDFFPGGGTRVGHRLREGAGPRRSVSRHPRAGSDRERA